MAKQSKLIPPFLPEDVFSDNILVRVPVRSIARFRCVSKSWRSMLCSPKFARAHLDFHTDHDREGSILLRSFSDIGFCTVNLRNEIRTFSRRLALPSTSTALKGSCHGLVLLLVELHGNIDFGTLDLFNPITLETLKIKFRRFKFNYSMGLGYDSLKDDYKIVWISDDDPRTVGIYSVKSEMWKVLGDLPYHSYEDGGFFINGCLHWPAWTNSGLVLAAFNVAHEEFKELAPPTGFDESSFHGFKLTVLGGCLALMFQHSGSIDFWVMKEYGVKDSWTKYSVTVAENGRLREFGVLGEDEIVFVKGGWKLLACNWRNGASRNLVHAGIPCTHVDGIANFRESLISPKHV